MRLAAAVTAQGFSMTLRQSRVAIGVAIGGFVLASVAFGSAARAESLRCKDRVISLGFTMYDVSALCGPADEMAQRSEVRIVRRQVPVPCGRRWCSTVVEEAAEVPVEEWVYDFGKQRFLQYLTFEGGRLIRIKTGEYGHKEDVSDVSR
jgi:Protein of unknown function (DUF2845)